MGAYNYASPNDDKINHGILDVIPYSNEWWGKGWFNVPGAAVNCTARKKNIDKYKSNRYAIKNWENNKEQMH